MNERFGSERADLVRREAAIQHAREVVGDGYQLGTISVKHDPDNSPDVAVWVKATCSEHDGELGSWVTHPLHLRQLALTYAYQVCPAHGHEQDYDALVRESMPENPDIEEGDIN